MWAANRDTVNALFILKDSLASALLGVELTFKWRPMRKQLLIPKYQQQRLFLSPKIPTAYSPVFLSGKKKTEHNLRKHAWSEPKCCWRPEYTARCTTWCSCANVKPGLIVASGWRCLFRCVLMRHHEGMLRVRISRRLATYSTALGEISNTAALLISYGDATKRDSNSYRHDNVEHYEHRGARRLYCHPTVNKAFHTDCRLCRHSKHVFGTKRSLHCGKAHIPH